MKNCRKSQFVKIAERFTMVLFWAFVIVVAIGLVRTMLYADGMGLIHHWYDAPARWVAKFVYGLFH